MSGTGEVGSVEQQAAGIDAILAANPQDVGSSDKYEVTDGGFADPEAGPELTAPPEPIPATPEQTELESNPDGITLGAPPEAPESTLEEAGAEEAAEDPEAGTSYDDVVQGLTQAASAERKARQAIQETLSQRDEALAEAQNFREKYEPHIDELSELWPQIQKQTADLATATRTHEALNKRLELYRSAAREAGIDVGEEALAQQELLADLQRQTAELPNIIDQRVSRIIDSRSQNYAQGEAQRYEQVQAARAVAERETAIATKLDNFYEKNPAMKEFDTFIRREVADDPSVDPASVAAPFLKIISSKAVKGKAKSRASVKVAGGNTSQATASAQEAAGQSNLGDDYANMSIDAQIAKLQRSGVLG